ncbi:hypothetical protein Acr_22g0009480 [Actinidia rufa]|uniref:Uncharacterized protein n=1 Tax=Actinidia rufa TaxID=165716 RepID=A0A7J0GL90_9ERIC|nr:hypothetical protein Acr_22g0009480 [Actinidia rufa]
MITLPYKYHVTNTSPLSSPSCPRPPSMVCRAPYRVGSTCPDVVYLAIYLEDDSSMRLHRRHSYNRGAFSIWQLLPFILRSSDTASILGRLGHIPSLRSNSNGWLLTPDFYHNSLAPYVGTTILNFLCTGAVICYLDRHLRISNPPPPAANVPEEIDWSRRSHRTGDQDSHSRHSAGQRNSSRSRPQRVCNPGAEGILLCWNLGHQVELWTQRMRKLGSAEDNLVEVTELLGAEINPPPKRLRTWMLGLMPSTSVQMPQSPLFWKWRNPVTKWFMAMDGLRLGLLFDSLSKNVPKNLSTLQNCKGKVKSKRSERDARERINERYPRTPLHRFDPVLPPLNAPITQVIMEIKNDDFIKWPGKIKTNPLKRNKNKYCEFHKDHSHNTEDCFQLKEQIAYLIKRGYLRKYVADRPRPNSPDIGYDDNRPTTGDIQTIHGSFGSGGCSSSSRKRHAREASPISYSYSWICRKLNRSAWVDQVSFDSGDGATLDHNVARFHCCGLPFAL